MDVDFHIIDNILSLEIVSYLGAKFSFLGEEIFEKYDDRGFHLLENVLVYYLFSNFVAST